MISLSIAESDLDIIIDRVWNAALSECNALGAVRPDTQGVLVILQSAKTAANPPVVVQDIPMQPTIVEQIDSSSTINLAGSVGAV